MLEALAQLNFGAPLALFGLLSLPVLWWVLRATPPKPVREILPSFRLVANLAETENQPSKTPWWLILLRLLLVVVTLLALALPERRTPLTGDANIGSALFVIDDGWISAPYWEDIRTTITAEIEALPQDARVHFLLTTEKALQTPTRTAYPKREARALVQTLQPMGWLPNRANALTRLTASALNPDQIYWFTDGLFAQPTGVTRETRRASLQSITDFASALSSVISPQIYLPKPQSILRIQDAIFDDGKYKVIVQINPLAVGQPLTQTSVSALTESGLSLGKSVVNYDVASGTGEAIFDLPFTTAQRISRFVINAAPSAGRVLLTQLSDGPKYVGLVQETEPPQPLLTDAHYIQNALADNLNLRKASVAELLLNPPSIIIMADGLRATKTEQDQLLDWVRGGGLLVRFALADMGEKLAQDKLLTVPLRRTARNLGSALNWDAPQPIAGFPPNSPFFELTPDSDVRINRQVLARANPDLVRNTWAELADGSPLISFRRLGEGRIVFFHIGATPDWSNLVLSPLFPQMWTRLLGLAKASEMPQSAQGQYSPLSVLNAEGRFAPPSDTSAPMEFISLTRDPISQIHPAGYYAGPSGRFARNAGVRTDILPITSWPQNAAFLVDMKPGRYSLTEIIFALAAALFLLEMSVFAFFLMRPLRYKTAQNAAVAVLCLGCFSVVLPSVSSHMQAFGQTQTQTPLTPNQEASLGIRLAYIPTGDSRIDSQSERGLAGLSRVLFLRTSVEPESPHTVDLAKDALELYPMIYWPMPDVPTALAPNLAAKLNAYMRAGGAVVIDTRSGDLPNTKLPQGKLAVMLAGIDVPPLARVPDSHVINRAFYLISEYPGRFQNAELWIDAKLANAEASGVSRLIIGDADWASAWATDSRGRSMVSVDGGQRGREYAFRFGVNLVMYILTGSYKSDQVHLPALIERLGEEADFALRSLETETDSEAEDNP